MQVTDRTYLGGTPIDVEKLKNDIQYNINVGLDILNNKWKMGAQGLIPTINDNSRDVIEHWYFAVLAYNGLVEKNSPIVQKDGSENAEAYQEGVFRYIETYNNNISLIDLPFSREDFRYDPNDKDSKLNFNKFHYKVPAPLTKSRHLFEKGDKVYTVPGTHLRETKDGAGGIRLVHRQVAKIIDGEIKYDTSAQSHGRHWVRYHVELEDGRSGYVASGAIEPLTSREAGINRFETGVEISKAGWQDGADTVVLSKSDDFPDALAGAPLAYKNNAPILLTPDGKAKSRNEAGNREARSSKSYYLGKHRSC